MTGDTNASRHGGAGSEPRGAAKLPARHLVLNPGGPDQHRYTFFDRVEIRRGCSEPQPGVIFVDDPTISSRHCVITQSPEGECFIRDISRNGTRVAGRRLVPNIEVELPAGEVLTVGHETRFRLEGAPAADRVAHVPGEPLVGTLEQVEKKTVTVLVGDVRNYTVLVREAPTAELQASVNRLFSRLEREVVRLGGTVKEHQGDAIFAFWEEGMAPRAVSACSGALALNRLVVELARDRAVWSLDGFPLQMDWALATGRVIIHSLGGERPTGLSVVGEPVVLAFRMEKLAGDDTGPILACRRTLDEARGSFDFDRLGSRQVKGFESPVEAFALREPS